MSERPKVIPARRVIVGLDRSGHSTVASDDVTRMIAIRPNGAVVQEIWRQESLPALAGDNGTRGTEVQLAPPPNGLVVRLYTCPPDSQMDLEAFAAAAESIYGAGNAGGSSGVPGIHRTQTVDIITVVQGEIHAVFESGETRLGVGDSLVLSGSMHAWSNRTELPATVVSTVFPLSS